MSEEDIRIDEYKLLNVIATGSLSIVWEVQDMNSNEHYAMKLLLPEAMKDPLAKNAMKSEAMICKKFDHPNIIRMHQFKQSKLHCYYIMDYFNAPNVKSLLRNNARTVQARIRRLTECVALGLGHIHEKGFVHRDIKPDNVLMSKSNEIKMIDFSLAAPPANALMGMLGMKSKTISGTRTYLPPEVIKKGPATFQSDIYSFGIMIYECLVGRPPFMGGTPNDLLIKHIREKPTKPSDLDSNVSSDMDDFVLRLLAKNPKDRPKDIPQFISEFRNVKIFKEDPELVHKKLQEKEEDNEKFSATRFLTSREDAERREKMKSQKSDGNVSKVEIPAAKVAAKTAAPAKPEVKQPVKAQPVTPPAVAPQMQNMSPQMPQLYPMQQPGMPMQMPGYPGGMYPQQMPPQMYPPGYPYPQMPMSQMPPGYPQQPMMPPPGYPQQGNMQLPPAVRPPQNMPQPPGTVNQQPPVPQQPVNQQPAPPQKPTTPPKPPQNQKPVVSPNKSQPTPEDDMPLMDELPDVI